jgi:hypothetical protein
MRRVVRGVALLYAASGLVGCEVVLGVKDTIATANSQGAGPDVNASATGDAESDTTIADALSEDAMQRYPDALGGDGAEADEENASAPDSHAEASLPAQSGIHLVGGFQPATRGLAATHTSLTGLFFWNGVSGTTDAGTQLKGQFR